MLEPSASARSSGRAPYVFIILSLGKPWLTNDPPVQSISEKIDGLKDEIKGKIKHDPELVAHGREQRTGEVKRKEMRQVDSLLPWLTNYLTQYVFRRTSRSLVSLTRLTPMRRNTNRSMLARSSPT